MLVGIDARGPSTPGRYRITEILADPPDGRGRDRRRSLCCWSGAISKSALVPFHFWLPGAMAAPTPVSAYLHAAAMVKAGVYLVALLAPAFAGVPGWRDGARWCSASSRCSLGGVAGAAPARPQAAARLRHRQPARLPRRRPRRRHPGGARSPGLALLVAHALFKATLFLVVGVDRPQHRHARPARAVRARPRRLPVARGRGDARRARRWPVCRRCSASSPRRACSARCVDVARDGDGTGLARRGRLAARRRGGRSARSSPSAYTARFLWGAFATKPGVAPAPVSVRRPRPASSLAPVVLAALVAGARLRSARRSPTLLAPYADQFPPGPHDAEPRAVARRRAAARSLRSSRSASALTLFVARERRRPRAGRAGPDVERRARLPRGHARCSTARRSRSPASPSAGPAGLPRRHPAGRAGRCCRARRCSSRPRRPSRCGSGTRPRRPSSAPSSSSPPCSTARSRRRLTAVMLVGVTGYGTAMLFVLHGAPDLALTQVLVETRHPGGLRAGAAPAARRTSPTARCSRRRYLRMALGAAVGGRRRRDHARRARRPHRRRRCPPAFPEEAVEFGGGNNIVNVTLVDIRAWDTLGEIAVLVAAATGVASLRLRRHPRRSAIRRVHDIPYPAAVEQAPTAPGRRVWLPGGRTLPPDEALGHLRGRHPAALPHRSSSSRSTCSSPATTTPAAASPAGWSPGWRWWSATSPAAATSSTRRRRSTPGVLIGLGPARRRRLRRWRRWPSAATVLQSARRRPAPAAARRGAPGHVALLRHRRLPGRRRAGARHAAQPRLPDRPPDPARGARRGPSGAAAMTRQPRRLDPRPPSALIGCGVYLVLERSLTRVLVGLRDASATASNLLLPGRRRPRRARPDRRDERPGRHVATRCRRPWCSPRSSSPSRTTASCSPWPTAAGSSTATTTCRTTSRTPRSAGSPLRDEASRQPTTVTTSTTPATTRRRRREAADDDAAADARDLVPLPSSCCRSSAPAPRWSLPHRPRLQRGVSIAVLAAVVVVAGVLAGAGRPPRPAGRCGSAPGPSRSASSLVADRLSALMLLVSAIVTLAVLVYSVGQGMTERRARAHPLSIYHPTFLVLVGRRLQRVPRRRPVQPLRRLRDPAVRQLRAAHPRRHRRRGSAPARSTSWSTCSPRRCSSSRIAAVYAATGTLNLAQLAERLGDLPDRVSPGAAAAAADDVRDQGGGVPAVAVAAGQLPDGARRRSPRCSPAC